MRWTVLLIVAIPAAIALIYRRLERTEDKRAINRMADKSRRKRRKMKRCAAYCGGLAER